MTVPLPERKYADTLKYSFKWGQSVVEQFIEKFARGTNFCAGMCGISSKALHLRLIYMVRCRRQIQWEAAKRVIRSFEQADWEDYRDLPVAARRKSICTCPDPAATNP